MAFDVQGARAAGYSDAEIADYIAPDYDFDTRGARGAGYSDAEILDHLLKLDQPAPAPAKAKQPTLPTEPETDEERIQRYRDSDAAGAPISAPMTQQEVDQWGETIRDIPTQVRATAAQTLAGMKAREFAELEGAPSLYKGDRGKSQEQIDAERRERTQSELAVAREAGADLAEIAAKDRTLGQRAVGGAATSLVQTALPMAVGIATRNPVVAAATMQPTTAGQTFAELANEYEDQRSAPPAAVPEQVQQDRSYSPEARTADLKRAALHGDIQGFLESGTEMLPFTKLFKRGTQPMNRLVEFLVQEIPGESVATVTQAIDDVIARSPPGVTVEEVMQGMQQGFEQLPETWATTLLAGGAQSGAVSLAESAARRAQHPPEEEDATFESVPDVPRLPAGTQINVDSAGTARTSESQRAEQDAVTAERDYQRDLGMEEVAGAVQGRAPIEIPEQRRLPASIPIEVDSDGTARTAESRRTEQAQASAEAQRRRDLGLNEVSRVVRPQEESSRPVEAQARPQATQNVELYQYQRTSKDLRGRQAEVRQITEEEFQQYIRPVLSDGVANSLEEYHAKYPSATHVRLRRTPKGIVLDQVGDAAAIRPSGPDVRRVAAFEDEDAKQFAIARVAQERAAPNRVNPETDSVLTAVSKLGGLSREEAVALGIEPKHLTHRGHGINLSFRRSGKKFTEMAQALQELGYAITDQSALHEAISQELSGSKATAGVKLAQPAAEVKRDEHETVRPVQAATPAEAPAPAVQVPAAEHRPQQAARAAGHAAAAADTGVATQADETPVTDIDVAAHAAATSPTNDRPEPTDAQKEAGNYAKGHVRLHGLDISIENPRGSTRRSKEGVSPAWEVEMPVHYGYVRGTIGADGEHIDISLGGQPENDARPVFVFDQGNGDGSFDEHKVFLGFHDEVDARRFYRQSFAGDFGKTMLDERLWGVKRFSLNEFKAWLANGDLKKPASGAVRGPLRNGEALPVEKPADPKAARKDWAAELGIPKGTKVRTTKAVGYLGANEEYNVEWVSKTRAYFRNIVTKGGTDLLKFDIQRAIKEGAIVPQSAEALAESTPVKTPISTGEKPTPDYEARWNSLDYGKRQDLAQQSGYGSMRAVVHRISGSKWAQLSPGEQTEMASAMESAEKAPTESVKPADSPRQKEPVTPQLPPAAGVAVPLDAQGPVVDDRMAQQIRDLDRTIAEDEADAAPTEDVSDDATPIAWLPREERYVEKLATPDVTIADILGDVDPIKAARGGRDLSDELTIHYGLLPRANRGIFAINELPDLAGKIQVGLFNIMQEGDIQIKGYPLRLPLDVLLVFTANPEDYTARGKIITPLKDRIGAEVRTHYPVTVEEGMAITHQEAWTSRDSGRRVDVPGFLREVIEEIAFQAREDKRVDRRSGVSQRVPITCLENVVSNAEQRAARNGETAAIARVADVYAALPAITGKIELEYEGELKGAETVARELVRTAVGKIFSKYLAEANLQPVVQWFEMGGELKLQEMAPAAEAFRQLGKIQGLLEQTGKLGVDGKRQAGQAVAAGEFILEGLWAHRRIGRSEERGYFAEKPRPAEPREPQRGPRRQFN